MAKNNDYIYIDFSGILKTIVKKLWIIILTAVIVAGIAGGVMYVYKMTYRYTPMYAAKVKMIMSPVGAGAKSSTMSTEFGELMRSHKVIDKVIEDLGLNISYSQLVRQISMSSVSGTNMVSVTVKYPDVNIAKSILDEVVVTTSSYAVDKLGIAPPAEYDYDQSDAPYNAPGISVKKAILYGATGGAVLALVAIILFSLMDKKIRSASEVKKETELEILSATVKDGKKPNPLNTIAMQSLYGELCAIGTDNKTLGMYTFRNEDKRYLIKQFVEFLKEGGKKTVYLNTQMTNPERGLATEKKSKTSMNDYLAGKTDKVDQIIAEENGVSYIIPEKTKIAVEMLSGDNFTKLINELKKRFDIVIVDVEPLAFGGDWKVLSEKLDMNVMVVEIGKTLKKDCKDLSEEFSADFLNGFVAINAKKSMGREFKREYGRFMGLN